MASDSLSLIAKGEEGWLCISCREERQQSFIVTRSPNLPKHLIKEAWEKGDSIKHIFYEEGEWIILSEKEEEEDLEEYFVYSSNFPHKKVKEGQERGFSISLISFCDDKWIVFMRKKRVYQKLFLCSSLSSLSSKILQAWSSSLFVCLICFGQGKWALLLQEDSIGFILFLSST